MVVIAVKNHMLKDGGCVKGCCFFLLLSFMLRDSWFLAQLVSSYTYGCLDPATNSDSDLMLNLLQYCNLLFFESRKLTAFNNSLFLSLKSNKTNQFFNKG